MIESNLAENLLEYLKTELENTTIQYKQPPKTLEGGQESFLYTFQLENAPTELSKKQVLRVYPPYAKNNRAHREGIVQKYLNQKGYPTPQIPFICSDSEPLGRPFIIMNFIEGETLDEYNKGKWDERTEILTNTLIKLQQIDPEPLRKQYISAGIPEIDFTGFCQYTDLVNSNIEWIEPAVEWVTDNKPKANYSICHGDYHPLNIILEKGVVRAVLDWVNVSIDDPLRDFSATYVMGTVAAPLMMPDRAAEYEYTQGKFLEYYRLKTDFDEFKFQYYQSFKCLMIMLAFEHGVKFYGMFGIIDAITKLFCELTGVQIKHK